MDEERQTGADRADSSPGDAGSAPPGAGVALGNWSPIPDIRGDEQSWVIDAWRRLCREPALLFTTAYVLVAFLGLWSSYWFYRGFGISILDYLQASDYLVAGLRDPAYVVIFASGVLLAVLVSWPDTLRRRYPDRIDALRRRRWWWRMVFSSSRLMSWDGVGIHPVTGISVVVGSFMLLGAASYTQVKGELLREKNTGTPVQVHLVGDAAPSLRPAQLLGTSSGFIYLWWPHERRAEAVPIAAMRRLRALPVSASPRSTPPVSVVPAAAPEAPATR